MASRIDATKIWPSKTSNTQPSEQMNNTNHWYREIPSYHFND